MADGIKIRELESKTILDDADVFVVDSFDQTTPTGTLTQQVTYDTLKTQLSTDIGGGSGSVGPIGATGPIGPAGPAGADGADGTDGADGADGTDGADGVDATSTEGYTLIAPSKTAVVLTVTEGLKTSDNRFTDANTICFYINGIEAPLITLAVGKTYRFDTSAVSTPFNLYQKGLSGYADYTTGVTTGTGFVEILVDENSRDHIIYDSTSTPSQGSTIDIIGSNTY